MIREATLCFISGGTATGPCPRQSRRAMKGYCEGYKLFLDKGRTEREVVRYTVELAEPRATGPSGGGNP